MKLDRFPEGYRSPASRSPHAPYPAKSTDHNYHLTADHIRYLLVCSIEIIVLNGSWYMPPEPVPADPGWDEDLAWLDRAREHYVDQPDRPK